MDNFCAKGELTNPRCYSVESIDFVSEESIFDILLDIFKSELPPRLALLKDCSDKPMYIVEEAIDIKPYKVPAHFSLILNPIGDEPTYPESRMFRTVKYMFELVLTVENLVEGCVTWELIRFKNAIDGLVLGAEIHIDHYDSVYIEPEGFQYFPQGEDRGTHYRQGAYRFSVTVTQNNVR